MIATFRIYRKAQLMCLFFIMYLFVGVVDQIYWLPDIYPFSDWYLFSYVSTHGDIYEIKYFNEKNEALYLFDPQNPLGDQLQKAVRFYRRGEPTKTEQIVKSIAVRYRLSGQVILVSNKVERLEYYKNKTRVHEDYVVSYNF